MKIKEMTIEELNDALTYMKAVPKEDPCFSGWNFDESEWSDKLQELKDELQNRSKTLHKAYQRS